MANLADRYMEVFAEEEPDFVPFLERLDVRNTLIAMKMWLLRAEALVDGDPPEDLHGELRISESFEGRGKLLGDLGPEETALLRAALRLAGREDDEDEYRTNPRRQADALVDLVRFFL